MRKEHQSTVRHRQGKKSRSQFSSSTESTIKKEKEYSQVGLFIIKQLFQ